MATCKSCGAEIIWVEMAGGKKMPLDAKPEKRIVCDSGQYDKEHWTVMDTYVSHFATCPNAAAHRKVKP